LSSGPSRAQISCSRFVSSDFIGLPPACRFEARIAGPERSETFAVVRTHQDADPPFVGERLHVLEKGRLRDVPALTPAGVLASRSLPLPLATRITAALAMRGAWTGPLASDLDALRRGLPTTHQSPPHRGTEHSPSVRARSDATAFALEGVRWGPGRGTPLFENFGLAGERGGIVALVGRSGSGKSSLLRLLAGIDAPQAGTAWRAPKTAGARRASVLALEYPERQLIGRTVLEDAAMTLWVDGVPAAEREVRARAALAAVGVDVDRFAERAPVTLSEGEKRRVALAGILAEPAPLLLFDEPTAGLDPEGRRALRDTFDALRAEQRTIVLASHDLDFVHAVADRVVLLARVEEGTARIVDDGSPAEVFRHTSMLDEAAIPPPDIVIAEALLRASGLLPATPARGADELIDLLERGPAAPSAPAATDVGAGAA
jgi:energy-coupling factor transport system ATP-binding protein